MDRDSEEFSSSKLLVDNNKAIKGLDPDSPGHSHGALISSMNTRI
jgi:hypothetical protein